MPIFRKFAAATLALTLAVAPALAADPTGTWQSAKGDSRYEISYCGEGGQLCAQLTWLRQDARTAKNLPYLNKLVVNRAVPTAANRWKGDVNYDGERYAGNLTLTGERTMKVKGCKGMFCQSFDLVRV